MITASQVHAASILVVDDREANVLLLEGMLRGAGYTSVSRALDARAVCDLHRANAYDLILLDLQMPVMDGFAVMDGLKELEAEGFLPVLVITAQPAHKLRALRAGARDFVSKPFDLAEVLMRVYNLIELRLLHRELRSYSARLEVRNGVIRKTFGRYLSDEIVESLLASPEALALGGERRTVTMMMADLRGYTAIAESLPPEKVVAMINNYLEAMIEIVAQHGGSMNDFTGDGFLAIFGAPVSRPDDARRAVACAVAMQLAMVHVNARGNDAGLPSVEMGIGINTGEVVVGNVGSVRHAKYGVVGSAVNLTSRIESFTTGGQVMISQSTLDAAPDEVEVDEQLLVMPKGVSLPIAIYSVSSVRGRPELKLTRAEAPLAPPVVPLTVRFAVMQGKDTSGDLLEGRITRLSSQTAEIAALDGIPPFANLKLQLLSEGEAVGGDVYAKVSARESSPGFFQVRFTSVPPEVKAFLDALPRASAS